MDQSIALGGGSYSSQAMSQTLYWMLSGAGKMLNSGWVKDQLGPEGCKTLQKALHYLKPGMQCIESVGPAMVLWSAWSASFPVAPTILAAVTLTRTWTRRQDGCDVVDALIKGGFESSRLSALFPEQDAAWYRTAAAELFKLTLDLYLPRVTTENGRAQVQWSPHAHTKYYSDQAWEQVDVVNGIPRQEFHQKNGPFNVVSGVDTTGMWLWRLTKDRRDDTITLTSREGVVDRAATLPQVAIVWQHEFKSHVATIADSGEADQFCTDSPEMAAWLGLFCESRSRVLPGLAQEIETGEAMFKALDETRESRKKTSMELPPAQDISTHRLFSEQAVIPDSRIEFLGGREAYTVVDASTSSTQIIALLKTGPGNRPMVVFYDPITGMTSRIRFREAWALHRSQWGSNNTALLTGSDADHHPFLIGVRADNTFPIRVSMTGIAGKTTDAIQVGTHIWAVGTGAGGAFFIEILPGGGLTAMKMLNPSIDPSKPLHLVQGENHVYTLGTLQENGKQHLFVTQLFSNRTVAWQRHYDAVQNLTFYAATSGQNGGVVTLSSDGTGIQFLHVASDSTIAGARRYGVSGATLTPTRIAPQGSGYLISVRLEQAGQSYGGYLTIGADGTLQRQRFFAGDQDVSAIAGFENTAGGLTFLGQYGPRSFYMTANETGDTVNVPLSDAGLALYEPVVLESTPVVAAHEAESAWYDPSVDQCRMQEYGSGDICVPDDLIFARSTLPYPLEAGQSLGNLTAEGEQITYALVDGPGGYNNQMFDIVGNQLHVKTRFAPTERMTLYVRISARTADGNILQKILRLDIHLHTQSGTATPALVVTKSWTGTPSNELSKTMTIPRTQSERITPTVVRDAAVRVDSTLVLNGTIGVTISPDGTQVMVHDRYNQTTLALTSADRKLVQGGAGDIAGAV